MDKTNSVYKSWQRIVLIYNLQRFSPIYSAKKNLKLTRKSQTLQNVRVRPVGYLHVNATQNCH